MKLFMRKSSGNGKRKSSRLWRWGWKISLVTLVGGGALGVLIFYSAWAHTFDMKKVGEMPERNTVLDVDGKIYSRLAGSNRLIVSLNEVAPGFIDALLAREDTRFFSTTESIFMGSAARLSAI
jgi:Membrane carboxypeptidase/penicillin-binding protein